jgi:DNA polymerase III subunit beta
MKIICEKAKLSEAVAAASRAVARAASISALEGIYMVAANNSVSLCGYNLDMAIRTGIKANIQESGEACIPAKLLGDIIAKVQRTDRGGFHQ